MRSRAALLCLLLTGALSAACAPAAALSVIGGFLLVGAVHTRSDSAEGPLEESCVRDCGTRLTRCNENECIRGCRISLDRLAEKESDAIFQCVERSKACDEHAFARCAVRIGPHSDGGPPLPPKKDDDD